MALQQLAVVAKLLGGLAAVVVNPDRGARAAECPATRVGPVVRRAAARPVGLRGVQPAAIRVVQQAVAVLVVLARVVLQKREAEGGDKLAGTRGLLLR